MFEGMSEEEKDKMIIEEFEIYESNRIKFNVIATCNDLAVRVQDAPGPKGSFDLMSRHTSEFKKRKNVLQ